MFIKQNSDLKTNGYNFVNLSIHPRMCIEHFAVFCNVLFYWSGLDRDSVLGKATFSR